MGDHARVDVGGGDLEVVEAGEAGRDQGVDDRPWLIALRRHLTETGARREVHAGADDQHAADAPIRLQPLRHRQAEVHEVARLDRRVGAQPARAIEIGDGVGRMFRPLGDELLLVDEAHRAQVLGGERRLQIRTLWNGLSQQVPEVSQPRVFSGLVERPLDSNLIERPFERGDPRTYGGWHPRRIELRRVQEFAALRWVERLDERAGTDRRLDRRKRGEARGLQQVEDQVVEISLTDPAQVLSVRALDVLLKPVRAETGALEARGQRRDVGPDDDREAAPWPNPGDVSRLAPIASAAQMRTVAGRSVTAAPGGARRGPRRVLGRCS